MTTLSAQNQADDRFLFTASGGYFNAQGQSASGALFNMSYSYALTENDFAGLDISIGLSNERLHQEQIFLIDGIKDLVFPFPFASTSVLYQRRISISESIKLYPGASAGALFADTQTGSSTFLVVSPQGHIDYMFNEDFGMGIHSAYRYNEFNSFFELGLNFSFRF
jgi:hypothetical protein